MTEHEKLVKIFEEVDTYCDNTFCNTCPYDTDISDNSCVYHALADKLLEYGYSQNNLLNKDIVGKAIREELGNMLTDILNSISDRTHSSLYCYEIKPVHIVEALKTVKRKYKND